MKILAAEAQPHGAEVQVVHLLPEPDMPQPAADSIATTDWSATPLGPLSHWSATLRIAVDMLQLSAFPSALVWGPQLSVIHNQAYPLPAQQGSSFHALCHGPWASMGAAAFQALEGRGGLMDEICLPGSTPSHYSCYYSPVRDDQRRVAGFLHTLIPASASAEDTRQWRRQAQAFEAQLAHYLADQEHTWQLSPDVMLMLDAQLRVCMANPAWQRLLGWSPPYQAQGPFVQLLHPSERTEAELALADVMRGGAAAVFEARVRHADGHYCWFAWHPVAGQGLPTLVGRDISATRQAVQRLAGAAVRESRRMESVVKVAGGLAHEMNNVLSGVSSSLELLERRLLQGRLEQLDSYVALARECAERAMGLTHNLLAFARSQPLYPSPLELNRVLRESEPMLRQALGGEMQLDWQLDFAPWPVQLDADQLRNALLHLCANARDACLGRGKLTVRSFNERLTQPSEAQPGLLAGDYVTLQIEDDGHGMAAADVARAFEPFFTSKALGQGAGLGLPMVHGFVCQSGGQVWIESQLGQGTRVVMMFPRFRGQLAEQAVPTAEELAPVQGVRVLLIDDEVALRGLMKEALVERGCVVDDVTDASAALDCYRQAGDYDLVITDVGLPGGFSGSQVARAIRMGSPAQKILFITGYTGDPVEQALLEQPGTLLLRKPFSLATLCQQVQHLLST